MASKDNIRKELDELAPKLSKIEKKDLFKVPENYFYDLSDKIQERVGLTKKNTSSIFEILQSHFWRFAIATIVIVVVSVSIFYFINRKQNITDYLTFTDDYILDEVDEELIIDYLVENNLISDNSYNVYEETVLDDFDENLIINEL